MSSSNQPESLLLLSPAPLPGTYEAVKAAYHTPLLLTLRALRSSSSGRNILDIALPCTHLHVDSTIPRSVLYASTQEVVANVYKLICIIAAREGIDVAGVEDWAIDVRVILMAYPTVERSIGSQSEGSNATLGPVIGMPELARSGRNWQQVFSVETEQGEQTLKRFVSLCGSKRYNIQKVRGGTVQVTHPSEAAKVTTEKYCDSVAVGGTFDHLHIGHKLLLTMTAFALDPSRRQSLDAPQTQPKKVITVGMTAADLLAKKKYAEVLQSWKTRTELTHAFLRGILYFSPEAERSEHTEEINEPGPNGHAVLIHVGSANGSLLLRYVEIWDACGPTITDPDIDTLIVSGETRAGGKMVNDKREELGMTRLEVFEVDVLDAEEAEERSGRTGDSVEDAFQSKLSSTEIRKMQFEKAKGRSKV
jgi:phosphopantetheine adenylyltransferase